MTTVRDLSVEQVERLLADYASPQHINEAKERLMLRAKKANDPALAEDLEWLEEELLDNREMGWPYWYDTNYGTNEPAFIEDLGYVTVEVTKALSEAWGNSEELQLVFKIYETLSQDAEAFIFVKEGWYSSYSEDNWDGKFFRATPRIVEVTVYEDVANEESN